MDWLNAVNVGIAIIISLTLFLGIGWKAWASITTLVNSFGERLNRTEIDVAKNDTQINTIRGELRSDRDMMLATMNSNEKTAAERHANLRVDFARIEERLDIEKLVKVITSEMRNQK